MNFNFHPALACLYRFAFLVRFPANPLCYDERAPRSAANQFDGSAVITKIAEFDDAKFRQGIILFNSREFFKAHEVWEELWLVAVGPDKMFLQGLIQLAAASHHDSRGNREGTKSLLEAAMKKLEKYPDKFRGVNLHTLRGAANSWIAALVRGENAVPNSLPRIE
ncbi:MAG: DUF309 domain-containing protein [Candidatus Acidiferrales bacterium]